MVQFDECDFLLVFYIDLTLVCSVSEINAAELFAKLSVPVAYGRGSVLIWRRCDMLYVLPVLWPTLRFT